MKKKVKHYCDECESSDIVRIAKYECSECQFHVCKKCEHSLMGECPQCPPPQLIPIKVN